MPKRCYEKNGQSSGRGGNDHLVGKGVSTMAQAKQAAKRKRRKIALPVMGAAGVSLALAGGASAISKAWASDNLSGDNAPPREITFGEEEIADVSLATFYVFDKEAVLQDNV